MQIGNYKLTPTMAAKELYDDYLLNEIDRNDYMAFIDNPTFDNLSQLHFSPLTQLLIEYNETNRLYAIQAIAKALKRIIKETTCQKMV